MLDVKERKVRRKEYSVTTIRQDGDQLCSRVRPYVYLPSGMPMPRVIDLCGMSMLTWL